MIQAHHGLTVTGAHVTLNDTAILRGVDLELRPGQLTALVGPNGAGKSTLLAVAAGDVAPDSGQVLLDGTPINRLRAREVARRRAVLPQEQRLSFAFRVLEVVRMGRTPWYRTPQEDRDDEAVASALAATDVTHLRDRMFPTLSGGEKARTSLSRVLAQETPVVLLDEPTAALDIRHQEQVLRVAHDLTREGCAVGVVLHDLSLAAAWSDQVCLLGEGEVQACGTPAEVFTPTLLSRVYGHPVDVLEHHGRLVVVPQRVTAPGSLADEPSVTTGPETLPAAWDTRPRPGSGPDNDKEQSCLPAC